MNTIRQLHKIYCAAIYCYFYFAATEAFSSWSQLHSRQPLSDKRQPSHTLLPSAQIPFGSRLHAIQQSSTSPPSENSGSSPSTSDNFSSLSPLTSLLSTSSTTATTNTTTAKQNLLHYLPDQGAQLPPLFRALILRATRQHLNGGTSWAMDDDDDAILEALDHVLDTEFRLRSDRSVQVADSSSSDTELVALLSLGALYQIPARILVGVLRPLGRHSNRRVVQAFATHGWSSVSFPRGLSVRPKGHWRWQQSRAATALCHAAAALPSPPTTTNRTQFFRTVVVPPPLPTTSTATPRPYFPNASLRRRFARWWQRPAAQLRRHGAAGVVSYALLNCLWYTLGMAWQWRRLAASTSTSTRTFSHFLQAYVTCFTTVYAAAQLAKVGKLAVAVALAPWLEQHWLGRRRPSVVVGLLFLVWASVTTGWPLLEWWMQQQQTVAIAPRGLVWGV